MNELRQTLVRADSAMQNKNYTEAHDLIKELLRRSYPVTDEMHPDFKPTTK